MRAGIEAANRDLLERFHRSMQGPFTAAEAAKLLGVTLVRAQRLLLYFFSQGWLSRVRHGLYVAVPLGATNPSDWREEPWIIATKVFSPCFIGGWSACEHWSMTEQVFRAVQVHTARPVHAAHTEIQQTPFRLRHVPVENHFGLKVVWHGQVKTQVSDPTRTLVDILDVPALGGGLIHVAEVFSTYFQGEHRNDRLFIEYAERLGNRSVFKRMGYLLERLGVQSEEITATCKAKISSGITALDPSGPAKGPILKRWNLRVNVQPTRDEGAAA